MSHTVTAGLAGGESPTLILAALDGVTLPAFAAHNARPSARLTPTSYARRIAGRALCASPVGRLVEEAYLLGYRNGRGDARGDRTHPDAAVLQLRRLLGAEPREGMSGR